MGKYLRVGIAVEDGNGHESYEKMGFVLIANYYKRSYLIILTTIDYDILNYDLSSVIAWMEDSKMEIKKLILIDKLLVAIVVSTKSKCASMLNKGSIYLYLYVILLKEWIVNTFDMLYLYFDELVIKRERRLTSTLKLTLTRFQMELRNIYLENKVNCVCTTSIKGHFLLTITIWTNPKILIHDYNVSLAEKYVQKVWKILRQPIVAANNARYEMFSHFHLLKPTFISLTKMCSNDNIQKVLLSIGILVIPGVSMYSYILTGRESIIKIPCWQASVAMSSVADPEKSGNPTNSNKRHSNRSGIPENKRGLGTISLVVKSFGFQPKGYNEENTIQVRMQGTNTRRTKNSKNIKKIWNLMVHSEIENLMVRLLNFKLLFKCYKIEL